MATAHQGWRQAWFAPPGGAWLGGVAGRNSAVVFVVGLGVGIVIGAVLTVHHTGAPANQAASAATSAPPKLAPAATPSAATPPATATLAPAPLPQSLPPANSLPPAGKPAWQQFALAMPATGGKPMIAIVIDDMGIDKADAARVIALPGPLTIAFMSYATELAAQAQAARAAGDEIWMHIPMEPMDGEIDAGPNALKVDLPPEEIRRRLDWALARLPGIVGVNNHMGSHFTQDAAGMAVVMDELRAAASPSSISRTIAATVASQRGGPDGRSPYRPRRLHRQR